MTDQVREAELRKEANDCIWPLGCCYFEANEVFLLRLLDAERERVKKLEDVLQSCQEIIEDYCEYDMCCQLRDTIQAALTTEAKP